MRYEAARHACYGRQRGIRRVTERNVLVINCGSSSLKFALIEPISGRVLAHGLAERLGAEGASLRTGNGPSTPLPDRADHGAALDEILAGLGGANVSAVGHRVVHGGEAFSDSVVLDTRALQAIEACSELAPLHNPANLRGIEAARRRYADWCVRRP